MAPPPVVGGLVLVADTRKRAFASSCFTAGRGSSARTAPLHLADEAAQALADLLPILMCGEASAEWVFNAAALADGLDANLAADLRGIAEDEQRHGVWLAQLAARLPSPSSRGMTRGTARFLSRLASDQLPIHLSRVAALDAGVCIVLAEACARGTAIAAHPELLSIFTRIRRDEGRHVRISRRCAATLGLDGMTELRERGSVLSGFAALLAPKSPAFAAIGVNMPRLLGRFERAAARTIGTMAG